MKLRYLIDMLSWVECLVCLGSLGIILIRKQARSFLYLTLFLSVRLFSDFAMGSVFLLRSRHLNMPVAFYRCYFYVYWVSYALESALLLMAVYGIYKLAMAPLAGLQRLGSLVFRWAAAISVAVSVGLAFGPKMDGLHFAIHAVSQFQQTSSILTLSLLLFVCFAIRPMGLSYRSRVFGVSLGLGLLSTTHLVSAAWITTNKTLYTPLNLVNGLAICFSFVVWIGYFAIPEPKRRMIVLPTTSPFLRWNQISQALGDAPGYVAIAGVPPEMFAEAEIEVMERASRKMVVDFPEMA